VLLCVLPAFAVIALGLGGVGSGCFVDGIISDYGHYVKDYFSLYGHLFLDNMSIVGQDKKKN
jgi:hypothetical protein